MNKRSKRRKTKHWKVIYKITYPNGKISVDSDPTDDKEASNDRQSRI
jgi:hypothetical protein